MQEVEVKEKQSSANQIDSSDELIRLVTSNADVTSQYVIFRNGYDELYAINVAKVEELIVNKELNIAKNSDATSTLVGTAKIRDEMCSIIHFDRWLGKGEAEGCFYELVVVCNFGHQRVGIIIKNVIGIQNIEADKLIDNSSRDPKTAQITELYIAGEKKLCVIFNSDTLLSEVFSEAHERELGKVNILNKLDLTKKILFADDSKIVQHAVSLALSQMELDFEVFDNGKDLLERLLSLELENVALILSDIEMPVMDGMALLREVKSKAGLRDIPFIMNTNMANPSIIEQAKRHGVDHVIHKLDVEDLQHQIQMYARV
ncbi:chemotaxis protein CheV [Sulfurospirillum oryzae]|uniref:chemotaxis protein CheV n=1 Tax=Sulfurospirillum oryzae TaxID=2976535 RepID=UPI0021E7EED3|nr:chemotaxis protein CheW [Sulfurospirillum oryzae]